MCINKASTKYPQGICVSTRHQQGIHKVSVPHDVSGNFHILRDAKKKRNMAHKSIHHPHILKNKNNIKSF